MFTWVMGGRVAGLITISTSPINVITFSTILKRIVAVLLRPKYKYSIIATYIYTLITITTTYITPLVAMKHISYSLITMNIFVNRPRIKRETQQYTTAT